VGVGSSQAAEGQADENLAAAGGASNGSHPHLAPQRYVVVVLKFFADLESMPDSPRLYLKVSTRMPPCIAVGGGPVTKLGSYTLNVEVCNKGKGAANRVRIGMTGIEHIERLGTLTPGDKPEKFNWPLEDQAAYKAAPSNPTVTVEYLDDQGCTYEQVGPLNVKRHADATFTYEGGNLEAPRPINSPSMSY
jgi:hypothetical protein